MLFQKPCRNGYKTEVRETAQYLIQTKVRRGGKTVWERLLTIEMHPSAMACEEAKRSWRVRIVTSVTGRLPPTPSMQSLHKPRPVFPPHMASIGGYCCCCCCCVCSHEKKKKNSRHSSTNLIIKSVAGKQMESAVSLVVDIAVVYWQREGWPYTCRMIS